MVAELSVNELSGDEFSPHHLFTFSVLPSVGSN
jgi:hypothetical protein